jgi:hypothetical protein
LKPHVAKGYREWRGDDLAKPIDLERRYASGEAGTLVDEEATEELLTMLPDADAIAYGNGYVGTAKGSLSTNFLAAQRKWNVWPKPAQETGDCVSRAGGNAATALIGIEVESGQPDEATGHVEGWPELEPVGVENGVVVVETLYGDRGHRGPGANCDRLVKHVVQDAGVLLRRDYTAEVGIDFRELNTRLGINWGGSGTPMNVKALAKDNPIRDATKVRGWEQALDFVQSGKPLWACSGLGWQNKRDENGYARQGSGWNHSWIVIDQDSRDETVRLYGNPLALVIHDWGKWNSGGRKILGTGLEIPEGTWWIDAPDLDKADLTAMAGLSGWKRAMLPNYLAGLR